MFIIDIFLANFNLFTPIFMAFGIPLGFALGIYLSRPKKNQVFKVLPDDRLGHDLEIIEETAVSLVCKPHKNMPPQRFLRYRAGFTVMQEARFGRLRKITRYMGRIGTAYSQRMEAGKLTNISLVDVLKTLWGNEVYAKMTDALKKPIEEGLIAVTVQLEEDPLTPKNLPVISEENIKQEEDRQAARTLWEGRKDSMKSLTMQMIFPIGLGVAIGIVAALFLGWIPVAKVSQIISVALTKP